MNILEMIEKKGARFTSQKLVSRRIMEICGLDILDLPDTGDLWAIIDELEMILEAYQVGNADINDLKEILFQIDLDFIQDLVYS